jgi:hypothetical protein
VNRHPRCASIELRSTCLESSRPEGGDGSEESGGHQCEGGGLGNGGVVERLDGDGAGELGELNDRLILGVEGSGEKGRIGDGTGEEIWGEDVGVGPGYVGRAEDWIGDGVLDEGSAIESELLEVYDVGSVAYLSVDGETALKADAWAELGGGAGIGRGKVDDEVGGEESRRRGKAEGELIDGVSVGGEGDGQGRGNKGKREESFAHGVIPFSNSSVIKGALALGVRQDISVDQPGWGDARDAQV